MNAAVEFAQKHSKHIVGAASVALISHSTAPSIWNAVWRKIPVFSLEGSDRIKTPLKGFAISTLAAAAVASQVPLKYRTIVALYAAAAILPAFAFKFGQGKNEGRPSFPKIISIFSSKISNLTNSSIPLMYVLSTIGAAGLLYANRNDLKPLREYLIQNATLTYKTSKLHFPAVAKAVAKAASAIVLGQGIGTLIWPEIIGSERLEDKSRIPSWTGSVAKYSLLAAAGGYLLNNKNLSEKYANIIALIFFVGLGISLFDGEIRTEHKKEERVENHKDSFGFDCKEAVYRDIEYSYSYLRSSILPFDVNKTSRAITLLMVGAAGLYLVHHPKIDRISKIFIQR
ncbi:MAG: hypothetical protein SNF33_06755 [Candidatus Algichlamydia australiensis]|nr:hypothetical protein [Chlamydiales bacterium]